MADQNYDPNARYDNGPNAAGSGRISNQPTLVADSAKGVQADSTISNANLRDGFYAAGMPKNNPGPNCAGSPRSINNN